MCAAYVPDTDIAEGFAWVGSGHSRNTDYMLATLGGSDQSSQKQELQNINLLGPASAGTHQQNYSQWNKNKKKQNKTKKQSIFTILTGISLTWSAITNIWVASCNFTTEWLHKF